MKLEFDSQFENKRVEVKLIAESAMERALLVALLDAKPLSTLYVTYPAATLRLQLNVAREPKSGKPKVKRGRR